MKKLMFMLAAVACAVTMQAAQLDWGVAAKSITQPGSSSFLGGQTSYLLAFASSAAADDYYAALKDGTKTLADAISEAVGSATGTTGKSPGKIDATATSSSLAEGGNYYLAVLTTSGSDKFILSGAVSGQAYNPTGTIETEGNKASFMASNFSTVAESRTGWTTAAPEPTSGILMLVGLGALALRRRKA